MVLTIRPFLVAQSCYTPNGQIGVCQSLQYCPSLIRLYQNDRTQRTINFLVASQRSCGNRVYGGYPVLCCTDGVSYDQRPTTSSPFIEVTTTTTTTTSTTTPRPQPPAPITQAPTRLADCIGPDRREGYCISLRACPSLLNEFISRQKDPQYISFIQQSNAICNYIQPNVCCPLESSVTSAPNTPTPTVAPPPAPVTEGPPLPKDNNLITLPTPAEGCGYSKVEHNRVVGGVPAALNGWPWMALIGYKNTLGEVSFKCGGSIITKRHVLTAAHCIRKDLSSVRLGEYDTSTDAETNHIDIPVVKMETYPQYDKKDGHSDLAILYLGEDVAFNDAVRPICLPIGDPIKSRNLDGLTPFVAGWGRTQEGGKSANVLQELQIPIVSNTECRELYSKIGKAFSEKQFDNAVLCAGVLEGGKDSCQGDSGGPLMFPQRSGVEFYYYQIGIVSYGIGCARAQVPGVYTRVTQFVDWIQEKVAEPV
ncbi:venom serine protease Bi-VSP-like isoform X2 [Wyeomyia smithii]|uniref:venom serine protease Bi-VSP-like isoform X2 n=1 Tax=Wyeomyia smithii TaxID=174621 RepID=UPI00246802F8|nr:venom serine protease Bi-VSP-like isoform X2 [Wyeomyia smithii]